MSSLKHADPDRLDPETTATPPLKAAPQGTATGAQYWRSLEEQADTPEFRLRLQREFPDVPLTEAPSGLSRRRFVQLMGASLALGSGSCRWEKDHLLPFTRRPEGHIPGVPQHYSTAMELGGYATGLNVTSYDGRPIKVEGNPLHPLSRGGTSTFAQASVLELYDPDRSTGVVSYRGGQELPVVWGMLADQLRDLGAAARATQGQGVRILTEASHSPTLARLKANLLRTMPQAGWCDYEPFNRDNERLGTALAFGRGLRPTYQLDNARAVFSLDDDFLHDGPASLAYARALARVRDPKLGAAMCRLYAAESRFSATGAMADHRLPLRSGALGALLVAVGQEIARRPGFTPLPTLSPALAAAVPAWVAEARVAGFVRAVAADLVANSGHALITVGAGQPPEVHALAHQLNQALHAQGQTIQYTAAAVGAGPTGQESLRLLTEEMHAGKVQLLLVLGGNPVFTAPPQLKFAEALARVRDSIHLSLYRDETSRACAWHVPQAHYLESWGDTRAYDGTISLQQPLISPLYQGKTAAEVLAHLLGQDGAKGQDLVRASMAGLQENFGDAHWRRALKDGFVAQTAWESVSPTAQPLGAIAPVPGVDQLQPENGALELTFWPDAHTYDGRFANNGWLQELPEFMTKLTWDNAALVAPETAKRLGLVHGELAHLKHGGGSLDVVIYLMPGQAPGSVAISLGHGRQEAGRIGGSLSAGVAATGFDTYPLTTGLGHNFLVDLTLSPVGKRHPLAITHEHHMLDPLAKQGIERRLGEIVREGTVTEFAHDAHFAAERVEHPPLKSLWTERPYDTGHRWGMAIDLNACTGCNACVMACQAENNIPIVGKEQVINGREMHWLRIDRYFSGSVEAPRVVAQAMLCQQCENAPCEQVCPVAATVHSQEGLNDMVYNRCIGTRYCSNNCPYKVRRFNFFNYHKNLTQAREQVSKMVYNPEVTVRARGVMEKCQYCVQRIQNKKILARNAKRPLVDGEITTACAQACPAGAITFGDLNLPGSQVGEKHADPRNYAVLEELNTKPRTTYLAKVTNPNPELAEGA